MKKLFEYRAIKDSPKPEHVHDTMFVKDYIYLVDRIQGDEYRVMVYGKFKNSLGGFSIKEQSIPKQLCLEFLKLI